MAWATTNDVRVITGVIVTDDERARAASILETVTGLIEAVSRPDISDRDRHFLKLATCYQAAWMQNHPDLFDREDVTSASQDGESAAYRNPDSHLLAPLARKSIRRLSWRGLRAIGGMSTASARIDVNSERFDDSLPWSPV